MTLIFLLTFSSFATENRGSSADVNHDVCPKTINVDGRSYPIQKDENGEYYEINGKKIYNTKSK